MILTEAGGNLRDAKKMKKLFRERFGDNIFILVF
jgi:hypothetical protein